MTITLGTNGVFWLITVIVAILTVCVAHKQSQPQSDWDFVSPMIGCLVVMAGLLAIAVAWLIRFACFA